MVPHVVGVGKGQPFKSHHHPFINIVHIRSSTKKKNESNLQEDHVED